MASPFFIVGCGRSGTTRLLTVLNRHSQVCIPPESLFIVDYLKAANRVPLERLKRLILREYELHEWEIRPAPQYGDIADCSTIEDVIARLHLIYGKGKTRWGQKTPRYVRHLDLLAAHFPDARFVHVVRDPRAVAASLQKSPVHQSPVKYGALRWAHDVGSGLDFSRREQERCLEVRFEALVADEPAVVSEVCRFIGIEPELAMFEASGAGIDRYANRYYQEVHQHIGGDVRSDRVDAWRTSLTEAEIATVEAIAGELMLELGYEPLRSGRPLPDLYSAGDRALRSVRQAGHYLRHRAGYIPCVIARKARLGLLAEDAFKLSALNR
jgi:hypothetical protein